MATTPRILSIQSHVVSGYAGNKSAVFPLQLLGFEVDIINSVQLCNHTGYKKVTGQILNEKDLADLTEGLQANDLDKYDYLLTGYVGNPKFLTQIHEVYKRLKKVNPNLTFVCDPVMGDNGELYVPEDLLPVYRDKIAPIADILTPNQFEAELLTGCKITNLDEAWNALEILHKRGCKTVVLSSTELGGDGHLMALGSSKEGGKTTRVTIEIPRFPGSFVGTGDLFAALLLSWMHKTNGNLKKSLENVIATLQAVLKNTVAASEGLPSTPRNRELKLIQSKKSIENPDIQIIAKEV